jgi:hypothetical protein
LIDRCRPGIFPDGFFALFICILSVFNSYYKYYWPRRGVTYFTPCGAIFFPKKGLTPLLHYYTVTPDCTVSYLAKMLGVSTPGVTEKVQDIAGYDGGAAQK